MGRGKLAKPPMRLILACVLAFWGTALVVWGIVDGLRPSSAARLGRDWQPLETVELSVSHLDVIVAERGKVHVFGLVTNNLPSWVFNASVVVALRDEHGSILQLQSSGLGTLGSGESAPFLLSFSLPTPLSWGGNYTRRAVAFLWPPDFPTPLPGFPNPPGPPIGGPPPSGPPPPVPTFPPTATPVPGTTPIPFPTFTPSSYPTVREALASIEDCYTILITYDAADYVDPWKLYDPTAPPFASDLAYMRPLRGYWLRVRQNCTLTYKDSWWELKGSGQGWNLIGWPP